MLLGDARRMVPAASVSIEAISLYSLRELLSVYFADLVFLEFAES